MTAQGWMPIETAPLTGLFLAIGVTTGNGFTGGKPYTTDPWVVWREGEGFARWPHHWPPTHCAEIPPPPTA